MLTVTTLHLVLLLILIPLGVGVTYGCAERLTARWLANRGWQVRDLEEARIGWEPEDIYKLPPSDEWLTIWEAYRAERRRDRL